MNVSRLVSGVALLFLLSCQEDIEELPKSRQSVFSLYLENYTTDSTDHWAIITDREGEVLSYHRLEEGLLSLETESVSIPNKINLTILNVTQNKKSIFYNTSSYLNIAPNETWNFIKSTGSNQQLLGFAQVQVTNFPRAYDHYSRLSLSSTLGGHSWSGKYSSSTMLQELNVSLYEHPADLLLTLSDYTSGPYYLRIPEAYASQSYFLDYHEEYQPADHLLHVSFPVSLQVSSSIRGLSNTGSLAGHILSDVFISQGEIQEFYMGYLDGYASYYTDWNISLSDRLVSYEKLGDAPTEGDFQLLPHDFTVTNKEFSAFSYTYEEEFDYRHSIWQKNETLVNKNHLLQWEVYAPISPEQNKVLLTFPEEITRQFPYLEDFEPLAYRSSRFTDYLDGKGYEDYLFERFKKSTQALSEKKRYTVFKAN